MKPAPHCWRPRFAEAKAAAYDQADLFLVPIFHYRSWFFEKAPWKRYALCIPDLPNSLECSSFLKFFMLVQVYLISWWVQIPTFEMMSPLSKHSNWKTWNRSQCSRWVLFANFLGIHLLMTLLGKRNSEKGEGFEIFRMLFTSCTKGVWFPYSRMKHSVHLCLLPQKKIRN